MIDIRKLVDIKYLLDANPDYQFAFLLPLLVLFALSFVAGIIVPVIKKVKTQVWVPTVTRWLRWFGFTGLALTFFRYEALPFLSMRLFWYVMACGFFIWLALIVRKLQTIKPVSAEQTIRQQTYEKYLPRPKQRRKARA